MNDIYLCDYCSNEAGENFFSLPGGKVKCASCVEMGMRKKAGPKFKKVDSHCENFEHLCGQTWGIVMYFLGALPSQEEWENDKRLQRILFDLPTWIYQIQAQSAHYKRLVREKEGAK